MLPVPIVGHTSKDTMNEEEDHGCIVFSSQNGSIDIDDLSIVSCLTESSLDLYNAKKRTRTDSFQFNPDILERCTNCVCADLFVPRRLRVLSPIPIPFMSSPSDPQCAQECDRGFKKQRKQFCQSNLGTCLAFMNGTVDHDLEGLNVMWPETDRNAMKRSTSFKEGLDDQVGLCQDLMTHPLPVELIYREHQPLNANRKQTMGKVPNPLEPEPIPAVIKIVQSPPDLVVHIDTDNMSELGLDDQEESAGKIMPSFPALRHTAESHIDDKGLKKIMDIIPSTISPLPSIITTVPAVLITPSVD